VFRGPIRILGYPNSALQANLLLHGGDPPHLPLPPPRRHGRSVRAYRRGPGRSTDGDWIAWSRDGRREFYCRCLVECRSLLAATASSSSSSAPHSIFFSCCIARQKRHLHFEKERQIEACSTSCQAACFTFWPCHACKASSHPPVLKLDSSPRRIEYIYIYIYTHPYCK
jgi:hypothetical protein